MRRIVPLVSTRHIVLVLATMIAVALVLVSTVAPKPADAATKVITKTFSSSQPITIPDSGSGTAVPYPSERNVQGFNQGRVLDVNLTLKNFSHTYPDDVDVLLAKKGTTRTVMSDVGGNSFTPANNVTLKLDDESPNGPLPDGGPLVGGSFRPTNVADPFEPFVDPFPDPTPTPSAQSALSGFDGANPNGAWKLRVVDDVGAFDGGQFAGGWSITIKAKVQN